MRKLGFAVFAVAMVAAACGGDDGGEGSAADSTGPASSGAVTSATAGAPGGELIVGRAGSIDGLQGDQCLGAQSVVTNPIIYDTLLRIAPDGQGRVGGLAESVDYDAQALTYTFHVREGVRFSDGSDLLADDVAFSIDTWRNGPISGSYFGMIESVEATDDLTVVVHLTREDTFLPDLFTWCFATVYPKDFGGLTAEEFFKKPVSAGPFAFESWTNPGPSETIRLVRNEYFWQEGLPLLDAIEFHSSTDPGQRSLAFEAGELDIIEGLDAIGAQTVPEDELLFTDPMAIQLLLVNSLKPELANVDVRRAISLAVDRDSIVAALDGHGVPAVGVLPINVPYSVPPDEPLHTDVDEAKSLLASAGVSGLSLDLLYDSAGGDDSVAAEIIADQLGQVGIDINLVASDSGTIFGRASSGDFDLAISGAAAISPTVFDPVSFLAFAYYPWTGSDTTVINEQFEIGTSSDDDAEREEATRLIQNDAVEQASVIGLYNLQVGYAVSGRVSAFAPFSYLVWYPDQISLEG